MLARFNNEVLSQGPNAILPQNLNHEWLNILQTMAEDFLDSSYDLDECKKPEDVADPILPTCVLTILRSQGDDIADISLEEILEKVTIYCLSLIMEAVDRESKVGIEQPTLENILSWDIIKRLKVSNPQFVKTLEKACILREPKQSWFERIKEKFI
jgi:hypothetical protein